MVIIMSNQILKELEKRKKGLEKFITRGTRKVDRKITNTVKSVRKECLKELDKSRGLTLEVDNSQDDYEFKVINNSTLDIEILGKYIAEIMSLYEGKKYCYQKSTMLIPYTDIENVIYLVVDENYKCDFYVDTEDRYSLNSVKKVPENGIVFSTYMSQVNFYRINEDANLISTVSFEKFPYVQEFINYIIKYRIDNLGRDLTDEILEDLKLNFVYVNLEDICARHGIREQEALDYLEEVRRNNDRVNREIDKIFKL